MKKYLAPILVFVISAVGITVSLVMWVAFISAVVDARIGYKPATVTQCDCNDLKMVSDCDTVFVCKACGRYYADFEVELKYLGPNGPVCGDPEPRYSGWRRK